MGMNCCSGSTGIRGSLSDRAVLCHTARLVLDKHSVCPGALQLHLNVSKVSQPLSCTCCLITSLESWLGMSWLLLFHKMGQSLFCVERQTRADRFYSRGIQVPCIPRTPQSIRRLSPAQCYHCSTSAQPSSSVLCSWSFLFETSKFRANY